MYQAPDPELLEIGVLRALIAELLSEKIGGHYTVPPIINSEKPLL
jgi:hypothetical protein